MTTERQPYRPQPDEWEEAVTMLCFQCARLNHCSLIDQMIECKDGGEWPTGGWVTDPGAGITCLGYQTRPLKQLQPSEIRAIAATNPATCQGCAARKGTDASQSLHTRRDFTAAVRLPGLFVCHEDPEGKRPCGGWCNAVVARMEHQEDAP